MRIRTIKPEFFLHEGLVELEQSSKLPVRLAFIGLWCIADREGRFKWEPRKLGVQVFPYESVNFAAILIALEKHGLIQRYGAALEYGCIPSFLSHQCINLREAQSSIPAPTETHVHAHARTVITNEPEELENPARGEGKGMERNGMEGVKAPGGAVSPPESSPRKNKGRASSLEEVEEFAEEVGATASEALDFWEKMEAGGWMKSKGVKLADWKAHFRNYHRNGWLNTLATPKQGPRYAQQELRPEPTWEEHLRATWVGDDDELEECIRRRHKLNAQVSAA
jgi:hypothetical protein